MRKTIMAGLMMGSALLLLGGCGKKGAESLDKGQVVATVDGKDITTGELNAELMGVNVPQGERGKAIQQAALQQIVNRTILADLARDRGLDKTPMYLLQVRRGEDSLLVQMLQRQLASQIKPPTRQEAELYMVNHPDLFANRKVFTVDQIQFEAPQDPQKLKAYEPIKTMAQFQDQLQKDGLRFRRQPATLDVITANPDLVQQVLKLPAGEIFLIPTGRAIVANQITDTKVVPFTGDQAVQYAMNMIQQQKLQDLVKRELDPKVKKARNDVKYQPGYAPPKQPAGQAGSAGAPANESAPANSTAG